jgi:hypothetical protein
VLTVARVSDGGATGGNLDVAQINSSVEHGRDEGVAQHVRMWPGNPHASSTSPPSSPS